MVSSNVSFQEVVPGLYECAPVSPVAQATRVYFLTLDDASPSVAPDLQTIWDDAGWAGWLIFIPMGIVDPVQFITDGRKNLPDLGRSTLLNRRGLVWLQSETAFLTAQYLSTYKGNPESPVRGFLADMTLSLDPISLVIPAMAGAALSLDSTTGVFTIEGPVGPQYVEITNFGTPKFYDGSINWDLKFSVTGPTAGAITQTAAFDYAQMTTALGCAIRYVHGKSGADETLEYPIYETPARNKYRGMHVSLHPLHPEDPAQSSVLFDFSRQVPPTYLNTDLLCDSFRTIDGSSVIAVPSQDQSLLQGEKPGFALCRGPADGTLTFEYYLSPIGRFDITAIDRADGSPDVRSSHSWMCGLSGQEYLSVASGDQINLTTGGAAYALDAQAGSPAAASPPATGALVDDYTTSWVTPPFAETSPSKQAFFGQASASTYYLGKDQYGLAAPAVSLLTDLDVIEPVPMVPYGRVFQAGVNVGVPPDAFEKIESTALAKDRHALFTAGQGGPKFSAHSKMTMALAGSSHNAALTPQGFVAEIDDAGNWSQVNFALSPDPGYEDQKLSFSGDMSPPVVEPRLATTLLQNQLFLVVSNADALGKFSDELALGGFNFVLDVGRTGKVTDDETILIFKYNTSLSLTDLAKSTELWADTPTFVRDLAGTQAQIASSIAQANAKTILAQHDEISAGFASGAGPNPPNTLAAFAALAEDPNWTGVIALNARIDANGMPPDLQMLLGGIKGQLRAHHFGVNSSQIDMSGPIVEITQSSLFGVIDYPSATHALPPVDTTDPFDYEVEKLNVVFQNSKIQTFNVTVGLTVNQLFGRDVVLMGQGGQPSSPQNTLEIAGRYQVQNGVGAVSFFTKEPFVYDVPIPDGTSRVISRVVFSSATLVPVSHQDMGSAGTHVQCRFGLSGGVWFNAEPFSNAPGLDLFSYGTVGSKGSGQAFSGLSVDIDFDLDSKGALAEGSKHVTGNLEKVTFSSSAAAARTGSLMHNLPLKVTKFLHDESGLDPSSFGATPVHVVELEPRAAYTAGSPVVSPALSSGGPAPNVTAKPHYAMEFDMPLGSLGALSNVHAGLVAKFILGWGPSTVVPGSDAAAVLVQLPSAFAGYGGFDLQGILKTTFGDANLLKVDLKTGPVYAVLFGNIKLSFLGFEFPPGVAVDFLLFAGDAAEAKGDSNIAWFLGAKQVQGTGS